MSFIKHQKVPNYHKMVSLYVVSLFTNVPVDTTVKIILKLIYDNNKISKSNTKIELKKFQGEKSTKGSKFYF